MNLNTFAELQKNAQVEVIKLRRSPDNLNHWFPMIHCIDGSVHLLIDNEENEISKESIEELVDKLKRHGAKKAVIVF